MNNIGQRIAFLMHKKGLTQTELAEAIGITQPSMHKIINGITRNPRNIVEIAKILEVDPQWLKTGKGEIPNLDNIIPSITSELDNSHQICIQQLDAIAVAGNSDVENANYPDVIRSIYFSEKGLYEIVGIKNPQGIYLITVPTDSMQPTINKGDVVFVDTKINTFSTDGVYIFDLNGHTYIKRLQRLPTGTIQAISDNTNYPPFEITEELFSTAVIRGKFIRVLPINPIDL